VITKAQLVLDLAPRPAHGREEFLVSNSNSEAVAWIDRWPEWPIQTTGLNIHGPAASGKTHLAAVWRARSMAPMVSEPIASNDSVPDLLGAVRDIVIDGLTPDWPGEPILHLHNLVAERGGAVLVVTRVPTAQMDLRPLDLASRLAAMPSVAIGDPDDALIVGVMSKLFRDRQLQVARDVLEYMASRMRRSLSEAARLVDRMDTMALAEGRPITLPLARLALSDSALEDRDENDKIRGD
jgi:chromosomal replication initiation ATPase DnaA